MQRYEAGTNLQRVAIATCSALMVALGSLLILLAAQSGDIPASPAAYTPTSFLVSAETIAPTPMPATPSAEPTALPIIRPTLWPTAEPRALPTRAPTALPATKPTAIKPTPVTASAGTDPTRRMLRCIVGWEPQATLTVTRAYREIGVDCATTWRGIFTPAVTAFPIVTFLRSNSDLTWWASPLNFECSESQAEIAACAAASIVGLPSPYVLYGNEPDGPDPTYSDAISPTLFATDFHTVALTLRQANPSVRLVVGGFLWANTDYIKEALAEYQRLYGSDMRREVSAWAWHFYPVPIGGVCPSPIRVPTSTACVLAAARHNLNDITRTVEAIDPGKPIWITEWSIQPFDFAPQADNAALIPKLCALLAAEKRVKRAFFFIGNRWEPARLTSVLNVDGTRSPVGTALSRC
jgi:hypothetical protein